MRTTSPANSRHAAGREAVFHRRRARRAASEAAAAMRRASAAAAARARRRDSSRAGFRPENLHITLWFIGEVGDERAARSRHVAPPLETPSVRLARAGLRRLSTVRSAARVLDRCPPARADGRCTRMRELGSGSPPLGFEPERRPYTAHLTLARVKDPGEARRAQGAACRKAGRLRPSGPSSVTLFAAACRRGAAYEPLPCEYH